MPRPSSLDDPDYAHFAWSRYWRLMRGMFAFSLVCVIGALSFVHWQYDGLSIHIYIATAGGVLLSTMLAAALMGLVFLSSGTGHDESIEDPLDDGSEHNERG